MERAGTKFLLMKNSRTITALLCSLVLMLAFSKSTSAQGVGSSRGAVGALGNNMIQGKVYGPNGRPVEKQLRVSLESNNQPPISTATDADGAFNFRGLEAGEYRLTVEGGTDFENQMEYPSIYREASPGGRVIQLRIQMRVKESLDPNFASVPADAISLYKKGQAAEQAGDNKKAIDQFSKAVAIDQKFIPALSQLGIAYLREGQLDKAVETLQSASKLAPDDFLIRLNYGIALLQQKKFDQSEEQLRMALQKNNSAPTAHMYLGVALMNEKKLDDAQKELEAAVASNSAEVGVAHKYLGGIYWGQRDYKRAADELETYLKLVPKAADAERTKQAIKDLRSKQ